MMYIQILAGFFLLLGGAEFLVRGAVTLAERAGISKLVIGMTVVALGTSAPELVVTVNAALEGASGLAVGNVIGSNIANILLILGAAGVVMPVTCNPDAVSRDGVVLAAATVVFAALLWQGSLGVFSGAFLVAMLVAFLVWSYWREAKGSDPAAELHITEVDEVQPVRGPQWKAYAITLGGIGAVLYGSDLLVNGGIAAARLYGVSEEVIGLTMIAFGTSLPELAASVVAAFHRHSDVALGNVVGSNLFNMLGVLGAAALITPVPVSAQILGFDLWVMIAATLVLMPFMMTRWELGRVGSALLLVTYCGYIGLQVSGIPARLFAG